MMQTDRLRLPPQHPEAAAMARELADYEIRVDQNANDAYGAFKVGTHDDLVTALGLAVWPIRRVGKCGRSEPWTSTVGGDRTNARTCRRWRAGSVGRSPKTGHRKDDQRPRGCGVTP